MFKFVNWLLVFTAGYWSLSIACMFLLFEDFGDPEPGSTGPQPDLAYGDADVAQAEHLDVVAEQEPQPVTEELVVAAEHPDVATEEHVVLAVVQPLDPGLLLTGPQSDPCPQL